MQRKAEPELMDLPDEVAAYANADFAEVNRLFVERLCDLTAHRGEERLDAIDLGCGPGDMAMRAARERPFWRIIAADASRPMLQWAQRVFEQAGVADRVTTRHLDAKAIDLPARSVDVIYSNSLVHHLSDPVPMWREVARLSRPGAVVFFRDLYRPADESCARAIVQTHAGAESELLREEFYRSLLSAYSVEEIRGQLQEAGLQGFTAGPINDRHMDIVGRL
jgi:ubiquinone/menaquinone biosynthesis C-methylase UbiE